MADHLRPLGYRVGLTGKRHFTLGTGKIDKIPGFPANANGSNQTHSFNGVRNYITKAKEAGDSFCIFIGSTHAHHPWDHGEESNIPPDTINLRPHYVDTPSARQAVAKHAAEVEVLDQQVRETREIMKSMNLEKDTIFIFLSEQGIAMPRGKWSPYEHGSRALCLAYWPEHIPARKTPALSMYCDLVPTLLDFAGGTPTGLDGKSLRSVWTTSNTDYHREAVFISNVHPFWQKAIVTDSYKLIWTGHPEREHLWKNFNSKSKFFSKPWSEWMTASLHNEEAAIKLKRILRPKEFELYKVDSDPYEMDNLAERPEQRDRLQTMHRQLKNLMLKNGESLAPKMPQNGNNKRQN